MEKIVSIFSGIDILGQGFIKQYELALAVELDKTAANILKINKEKYHPNLTIWNRDIYSIKDEEIAQWKGVSGLIGGPPCQPFSPGKHGFDPSDERIKGLIYYLRWTRIIQPEFFIFENTFGLLQGDKKIIFNYFKEEAEKLGYIVNFKILNAHDYGNAQERKRLIVVGVHKTANWTFNFPSPVADNQKKYVRDILRDEPLGDCVFFSEERASIMKYIPEGGNWKSLPTDELKIKAMGEKNFYRPEGGMTGAYRRLHRDKPCPTIMTSPAQRNTLLTHPIENRPLSVAECARGMGIPDDYQLEGALSNKYKVIGNAVPLELSQAIAQAIADSKKQKSLNDTKEENEWQQLSLLFEEEKQNQLEQLPSDKEDGEQLELLL